MNKFDLKKAAAVGLCCSIISTGSVWAMPKVISLNERPVSTEAGIENELLEKQRDIDEYVFETNAKEIADAGFKVTNTGPMNGYVEIGILPYNEDNANVLYNIFGTEKVKVVEGIQAVTLPLDTIANSAESHDTNNAQKNQGIKIRVNGESIELDAEPFVENDRTLIPLRGIMEKLGAEVEWVAESETVKVHTKDISIELVVGEATAKVLKNKDGVSNEEIIQLDVPSKIVGERTFIPGRFVTEALGAKVDWDAASNSMIIETGSQGDNTIQDEIGESLEKMGKAISVDSIKEVKLYSLMQEELKTFTNEEINEIVNHLNTSPTYHGAYITMLAGNNIKISLEDGNSIQLTSFGSKDYVIMSDEVNGEHISYCIISPEIGSILLSQEDKADDVLQQENENDIKAVRNIVEGFGLKLQMVSLQAPKDILEKSMQENYGDFVSQALLEKWISDPINAPGRLTSSPWPDRIEFLTIEKASEKEYKVDSEIIEVTSAEKESGGVAAKRPITLVVRKVDDHWLIDDVILGDYDEANGVIYKNTQYGFDFSLPDTWKDYKIVTDQWEGVAIGDSEGSKSAQKGPIINIRHPKWTTENQRQDIPIMIFTLDQWDLLQNEEFHIGAAPMGPSELGRNVKYVFALPARYNYAFPEGYEEVEDILENKSLSPTENIESDN